jgi:hypothetical protein
MFHHRLHLTGTDDVLTAAGADLTASGAVPIGDATFITTQRDGAKMWRQFALNHPAVRLSVDVFEAFEDEFVQTIIAGPVVTTLSHRSVLPERFGCFDDGGEPIAKELLTAAGRAVAAERLAHDVGTLSSEIDDALTMGKALGRFCARIEPTIFDAATITALAAVREIAVFALWMAVAPERNGIASELAFDHALCLTQAVVQAGREELWEQPGHACWMSWAGYIIAGASELIEVCSAPERSPEGQLAFSARSLLTTCIQALALFGTEKQQRERAREDSNL